MNWMTVLALAFVSLFTAACQPPPPARAFCEATCACEGCSPSERETCAATRAAAADDASRAGCRSAFEARAACVTEAMDCHDDRVAVGSCEAEDEALAACLARGRRETTPASPAIGEGGSGGGDEACGTCADVLREGRVACGPAAEEAWAALDTCACRSGVCGLECEDVCYGWPLTSGCATCLAGVCAAELGACFVH